MKRLLIFTFAVACGLLAAYLSFSKSTVPAMSAVASPSEPLPVVNVLVSSTSIPRGSVLDEGSFQWQEWPEAALSEGLVTFQTNPEVVNELSGKMVRNDIGKGEPIRLDKIVNGDDNYLASLLSDGMRAVTVVISASHSGGGFLSPDDRVDVVHTKSRPDRSGAVSGKSRTLLRNVRILKIGTPDVQGSPSFGKSKTATLEVLPEQVELLSAAESTGSISLALRPMSELGSDPMPAPVTVGAENVRSRSMIKIIGSGEVSYVEPRTAD